MRLPAGFTTPEPRLVRGPLGAGASCEGRGGSGPVKRRVAATLDSLALRFGGRVGESAAPRATGPRGTR
jgi:hypothetical protein